MTHKLNSDKTAAVSLMTEWLPIDASTPRGVKMLLISKAYGVAQISALPRVNSYWTHWNPLPHFKRD